MSHNRSIVTAVQKLAGTFKRDNVNVVVGTVISVDETNAQCNCRVSNDVSLTCNLQSGVCDGLLITPAVGSTVIIIYSTYNDPVIVQYGDVDKFYLQAGEGSVVINNDGSIIFNGGNSPAVLGDKNKTALTDVYNTFAALAAFASTASTATSAAQIAVAATTLNTYLNSGSGNSKLQNDINATTSTHIKLN